jgi:hypothetical protein
MDKTIQIARQVSLKFKDISEDEIEIISIRENGRKGSRSKYSVKVGTKDTDYYFDGDFNLKTSKKYCI